MNGASRGSNVCNCCNSGELLPLISLCLCQCTINSRCNNSCALQVYGGAISLIIGSYSWCQLGQGLCIAQAVDTYCIDCAASLSEVVIFNSTARSNTWSTRKLFAPLLLCIKIMVLVCHFVTFCRSPQMLLHMERLCEPCCMPLNLFGYQS